MNDVPRQPAEVGPSGDPRSQGRIEYRDEQPERAVAGETEVAIRDYAAGGPRSGWSLDPGSSSLCWVERSSVGSIRRYTRWRSWATVAVFC